VFNGWMTRQSRQQNAALVAAYDFSSFRLVADVGGGRGSTLAAILAASPSLRGILLDLPQVIAHLPALDEAGSGTGARSWTENIRHGARRRRLLSDRAGTDGLERPGRSQAPWQLRRLDGRGRDGRCRRDGDGRRE